jgi:hypothetical protein
MARMRGLIGRGKEARMKRVIDIPSPAHATSNLKTARADSPASFTKQIAQSAKRRELTQLEECNETGHLCEAELGRIARTIGGNSGKPHFLILHRFHQAGSECLPGELIAAVWLVRHGQAYPLRLTTATLILFDYFARYRWLPQTATQVEIGLRYDPFYAKHASAALVSKKLTRRFISSSLKEYVRRLRSAMRCSLNEAGFDLDPLHVLASERTDSNQVAYRLHATVSWIHVG